MNKRLKYRLVGAAMLLCSPVLRGQTPQACSAQDLSPVCADFRAQALEEQVDKQLNAEYQALLGKLSRERDEYINYPQLKEKVVAAQRQWLRFLAAECDAWYLINEAGAQRNVNQMQCLIDVKKERIARIRAWQHNLP